MGNPTTQGWALDLAEEMAKDLTWHPPLLDLAKWVVTITEKAEDGLIHERDEARADALVLAHAYTTDNRPPMSVVQRALAYQTTPADSGDRDDE